MSQAGVYSESKMLWWYAREQKLPDAPKQVQLILSGLCNQSCSFCAYRMDGYTSNELFTKGAKLAKFGHNNPIRWMDTDRALELLDEIKAAGALSIQFTGGGEPTVHPDHEIIFTKALELGLRCSLVSNGVKWSYALPKDILPRFDWVRVSIDAGSRNYYSKLRQTPDGHWGRVWENVKTLAGSIRAENSQTALGLGFVVTPESYRQIPEFTAIASASGAHNVRFTAMFSNRNAEPFVGIYDEVRSLISKARADHEAPGFAVYDNFGSRFEDLRQLSPDYRQCAYQYYTTYIGDDLKAYRCCILAYNKRGMMEGGDLSKRRFDEFWKSKERKEDMASLDARGCPRCQFNAKNRGMVYVIGNTDSDTTPRHIEWP